MSGATWRLEWDPSVVKFLGERFSSDPAAAQHAIDLRLRLAGDPYPQASAESPVAGIRTLVDAGIYVVYEPLAARETVRILGVGRIA